MDLKKLFRCVQKPAAGPLPESLHPSAGTTSPYANLPAERFWRTGVAEADPFAIANLFSPRFPLSKEHQIACAGSCFAQHISAQLRTRGFNVLDKEPAPKRLNAKNATRFGYNAFSARYANIYVVRQLRQLAEEALTGAKRADDEIVWNTGDRYFDALRPAVEPDGLSSAKEVRLARRLHLEKVKAMFLEMDVFIFTLGLTECWENKRTGLVYPTCPGTVAGTFDPGQHRFVNLGFKECHDDFVSFRKLILRHNPRAKFILTVSPVPLTATAADQHVLTATTYSKSILRAVAGELRNAFADVDYFPSYEIITGPQSRGRFYENNLRGITPEGVSAVMNTFFSKHSSGDEPRNETLGQKSRHQDDLACEEAMLEAFNRK